LKWVPAAQLLRLPPVLVEKGKRVEVKGGHI
jgi:hypothetical protein